MPAHEVWIQPHSPQVETGAPITADLRIGDMFAGNHLLYIRSRRNGSPFSGPAA